MSWSDWIAPILFVIVICGFGYLVLHQDIADNRVCSSHGSDYYSADKDVHGVHWVKCCVRAIPDDQCNWVKA